VNHLKSYSTFAILVKKNSESSVCIYNDIFSLYSNLNSKVFELSLCHQRVWMTRVGWYFLFNIVLCNCL